MIFLTIGSSIFTPFPVYIIHFPQFPCRIYPTRESVFSLQTKRILWFLFVVTKKSSKVSVLIADDPKLISGCVKEKLRSFGPSGLTGRNTFCTDNNEATPKSDFVMDTVKITGLEEIEEVKAKTKMKRKVIFYRFGLFTIKVIPGKHRTSLRWLFLL